jgi:hypothetical protein
MRFPPYFQLFEIRHASLSILKCGHLQLVAHGSKLKAFYKILSRHLPDFARQFQFEQGGKDF